jgi:checkpoint serine/threonine-protein kinase
MDTEETSRPIYEFAEWEGHKENIQPLKRGRKPSELRRQFAPLQTISEEHVLDSTICYANHNDKHKLAYERGQWEQKVNQPSMDPLQTWMDYLRWIEDNYPNLPPQSRYIETLQTLTRGFVSNPDLMNRYRNDERLVNVWLKYADMCEDPTDVFAYMDTNGMGTEHAQFHIQWANFLENRQDYKAADAVLQLGVQREAQVSFFFLDTDHSSLFSV